MFRAWVRLLMAEPLVAAALGQAITPVSRQAANLARSGAFRLISQPTDRQSLYLEKRPSASLAQAARKSLCCTIRL